MTESFFETCIHETLVATILAIGFRIGIELFTTPLADDGLLNLWTNLITVMIPPILTTLLAAKFPCFHFFDLDELLFALLAS